MIVLLVPSPDVFVSRLPILLAYRRSRCRHSWFRSRCVFRLHETEVVSTTVALRAPVPVSSTWVVLLRPSALVTRGLVLDGAIGVAVGDRSVRLSSTAGHTGLDLVVDPRAVDIPADRHGLLIGAGHGDFLARKDRAAAVVVLHRPGGRAVAIDHRTSVWTRSRTPSPSSSNSSVIDFPSALTVDVVVGKAAIGVGRGSRSSSSRRR